MMRSEFHTQADEWGADAGIPRMVYRTVPSIAHTPPQIAKNFAALIQSNPDWQQIVFDDALQDNYIRTQCTQQVIDAYFQLNPAYGPARADFFRYLIVYERGGVYLDQKSGVGASLNHLIQPNDKFLLAPTDPTGKNLSPHRRLQTWSGVEYMQWFIAAAPGHPFLAAVIKQVLANINGYRPLIFRCRKKRVLNVTGPNAYTLAIAPIVWQYPHRIIDADKEGWCYTVFESTVAHFSLSSVHYSKLSTPVVLMQPSTKPLKKILLQAEALVARFFGKLSVLNHGRLQRRRRSREQKQGAA